jgi:hypothetical protein
VFENRVLRKVLKTTREEIRGNWRKLYNEELYDLNSLSNTVGRTRWARHVARSVREKQNENQILVRKPEGQSRLMWEGINTMNGVILNVPGLCFLETLRAFLHTDAASRVRKIESSSLISFSYVELKCTARYFVKG